MVEIQGQDRGHRGQTTPAGQGAAGPDLWQTLEGRIVLERLNTSTDHGLSEAEAAVRLEEFGPNELAAAKGRSRARLMLSQFESPLVIILVVAAVLSLGLWLIFREERYPYDFIIITAIVILNAVLGYVQESRAQRALEALESLTAPSARLLRDGQAVHVPARNIVPGDLLILETGDRIPADARVLQAIDLSLDESLLTGESFAADKHAEAADRPQPLAERHNLLHAGTAIVTGRGRAVAVATGMTTELGKIAAAVAGAKEVATPLQKDMSALGRVLGLAVLGIAGVVTLVALLLRGDSSAEGIFTVVLFGVALAVAAIPEGLPAVVTVSLALGVRRMAARRAIVRRLPAVETLGSTTVICTDKTGTITRNELEVVEVYAGGCRRPVDARDHDLRGGSLDELLKASSLCNNALELGASADPTERALLGLAQKAGEDPAVIARAYPRLAEMPFSSERKRMTTIHRGESGLVAYTKGAPEVVLSRCTRSRNGDGEAPLQPALRHDIEQAAGALADEGLRVLALARRSLPTGSTDPDQVERDLTFVGLAAMLDSPREQVKPALDQCRTAGIRVVMITGDRLDTALSVARRVGLWQEQDRALTGRDLEDLSDEDLRDQIENVRVLARVDPAHKLRIVDALQANGHTVAMTGDGVNDAPALKRADIGIAMGRSGTDVAREASDMILTDDNFATIISAVEEGRGIFDNIKRFVSFLLSTNSGEVLTLFFGVILAVQLGLVEDGTVLIPLLAIHILWINLVTDGAPALALGVEPRDPHVLDRPPRPPGQPVLTRDMWFGVGLMGLTMCVGTLLVLSAYTPGGLIGSQGSIEAARTMAFTVLVLYQLCDALNWRTYPKSIFRVPPLANRWLIIALASSLLLQLAVLYWPPFAQAFRAAVLGLGDWVVIALVAASILVVMEIYKALIRVRLMNP